MENITWLSVLLCTYNNEKYIAQTIQSILDQSYPYFEFIIVNDGSKDQTLSVIKQFKDERIRIIDKANTGLTDSLCLGIAQSRHEWIVRIDGDDVAFLDRLEKQVNCIKDDVILIGGQCQLIDEHNNIIGNTKFPINHSSIVKNMKRFRPAIAHPCVMFRKSVYIKVGGYDRCFRVAQDYNLWLRMEKEGVIMNLESSLIKLRKHSDNISSNHTMLQMANSIMSKGLSKQNKIDLVDAVFYNKWISTITEDNFFHFATLLCCTSCIKNKIFSKIIVTVCILCFMLTSFRFEKQLKNASIY